MSLPYQMVFALLVFEMSVFGVLVMPLPRAWKKGLVSWVSRSYLCAQLLFLLKILFFFVVILFVDSIRGMIKTQKDVEAGREHHHHPTATFDSNLHSKLFYAQRNMYLTGFTLFLSIILNRFYHMIGELIQYEERALAVKKQADNNNKAIMDKITQLEKAETKIKQLEDKLGSADKASRDAQVLKSQANSNNSQYMELADRYNELEKKHDLLLAKMRENGEDVPQGNRRVSKKGE